MYTSTDANLQMKCANDSVKKMAGSIFKELFSFAILSESN